MGHAAARWLGWLRSIMLVVGQCPSWTSNDEESQLKHLAPYISVIAHVNILEIVNAARIDNRKHGPLHYTFSDLRLFLEA